MSQLVLFIILTILCFALSFYAFRQGHPFTILAFVIFNCGLIALDKVLFLLHEHITFHITSHSNFMFSLGLLVFFRNLHTTKLSKVDKVLLGIAFLEYFLIGFIYLTHVFGIDAIFEKIPLFELVQKFGRPSRSLLNPAIDFAMAKDFLLFFIQLAVFPVVFYLIWKELKKAKDQHLNFFTSDSFEFYTWNFRFIALIAFCYVPIVIIIFHDFMFEFVPALRTTAFMLMGICGLGLGLLTYFSPVFLKKESEFPKMVAHFKEQQPIKEVNDALYRTYIPQLSDLLQTKKMYRNPNLTLASLAKEMNISSRHLSRVINEGFGKNFSDFVNGYRIKEIKRNLLDPEYNHYDILSIALEAGFNSKTTFYHAFKKETGMNPAQFKGSQGKN